MRIAISVIVPVLCSACLGEGIDPVIEGMAQMAIEVAPVTTQESEVRITRSDGGSIRTELGYGIVLNENSGLRREWVAVHGDLPLTLEGTPGVTTSYDSSRGGNYRYTADVTVSATSGQSVTAFEVRFITFDIFGERMTTLSATEIVDIVAGGQETFDWRWSLFRENDASEYFASIAFIAKVRTADGQVYVADYDAVLDVVREFAAEATEADLAPPTDDP